MVRVLSKLFSCASSERFLRDFSDILQMLFVILPFHPRERMYSVSANE